ncbi:MAG: AGE family epimerase/isomerase [Burkholderiales bacterium]|nr:AGE family epimerase/isomerase [Burkholderiales bacterium]
MKTLLLSQLEAYKEILVTQLEHFGYCGEFISDKEASIITDTRLLCQTRGIFFLIDYATITNNEKYITLATKLYKKIQATYYNPKLKIWTQYPTDKPNQSTSKDKMLYEYAFIITAYSKLYLLTKDSELLTHINRVIEIIFTNFYNHKCKFDKLTNLETGINQNALMHLFEALIEATSANEAYKNDLQQLGNNLLTEIYDNDNHLIRENSNQKIYEPGHSFEWASLILEAKQKNMFISNINENIIAVNAENLGITHQEFVVAELSKKDNIDTNIRIWPTLERLRYYAMISNKEKVVSTTKLLVKYFFSKQNLPFEYLNNDLLPQQEKVKSTTGYHIINCYKYVLPLLD